jgi:hypothetical protein
MVASFTGVGETMMNRISTRVAPLAALALGLAFGGARGHAQTISLELAEDGPAFTTVTVTQVGNTATYIGGISDFTIALTAIADNYPGGPKTAELTISSLEITNTDANAHTLSIEVSAQGFTSPTGAQLALKDTASITSGQSSVLTGSLGSIQMYADAGNVQFGQGTSGPSASYVINPSDSNLYGATGGPEKVFATSGTSPYSISFLSSMDVVAGGNFTMSGEADVLAPEPATMASAAVGLGMIGGLGWLRRRNRRA